MKTSKDGLHSSCKECMKEKSRLWRLNNPKKPKPKKPRMDGFRLLPEGMRKCGKCKEIKEKKLFYKDSSRASGVSSQCKKCHNEYVKEKRKCPLRKDLVTRRKWAEENRDRLREQDRIYRESNRWRMNYIESKRRARKQGLPDTLTDDQRLELSEYFEYSCTICDESYEHLDHFIPLSTKHGGTTKENIVPMCSKCNLSKSSKNPFEWAKTLSPEKRKRFDVLVKYLSEVNGIKDVKDYEAYVNKCFK